MPRFGDWLPNASCGAEAVGGNRFRPRVIFSDHLPEPFKRFLGHLV